MNPQLTQERAVVAPPHVGCSCAGCVNPEQVVRRSDRDGSVLSESTAPPRRRERYADAAGGALQVAGATNAPSPTAGVSISAGPPLSAAPSTPAIAAHTPSNSLYQATWTHSAAGPVNHNVQHSTVVRVEGQTPISWHSQTTPALFQATTQAFSRETTQTSAGTAGAAPVWTRAGDTASLLGVRHEPVGAAGVSSSAASARTAHSSNSVNQATWTTSAAGPVQQNARPSAIAPVEGQAPRSSHSPTTQAQFQATAQVSPRETSQTYVSAAGAAPMWTGGKHPESPLRVPEGGPIPASGLSSSGTSAYTTPSANSVNQATWTTSAAGPVQQNARPSALAPIEGQAPRSSHSPTTQAQFQATAQVSSRETSQTYVGAAGAAPMWTGGKHTESPLRVPQGAVPTSGISSPGASVYTTPSNPVSQATTAVYAQEARYSAPGFNSRPSQNYRVNAESPAASVHSGERMTAVPRGNRPQTALEVQREVSLRGDTRSKGVATQQPASEFRKLAPDTRFSARDSLEGTRVLGFQQPNGQHRTPRNAPPTAVVSAREQRNAGVARRQPSSALERKRIQILERIQKIVLRATPTNQRRLEPSHLKRLDIATQILELLDGEEYLGIEDLRSRPRLRALSRTRKARMRTNSLRKKDDITKKHRKSTKGEEPRQAPPVSSGTKQGSATTAKGSAAPTVGSAKASGPSKSLDIFQAKTDDDAGEEAKW